MWAVVHPYHTAALRDPPGLKRFCRHSSFKGRNKDNSTATLVPLDAPLGRMCSVSHLFRCFFFFPTGGSEEDRRGRISSVRPFPYICHTMARLSVAGRRSGWRGISLFTHTMAPGDQRKWHKSSPLPETNVRSITHQIKQVRRQSIRNASLL